MGEPFFAQSPFDRTRMLAKSIKEDFLSTPGDPQKKTEVPSDPLTTIFPAPTRADFRKVFETELA
jgi:hypothetical protein